MYRSLMAATLMTLTLGAPRAFEVALFTDADRVSDASFRAINALLVDVGHHTTTFSGHSGAAFTAGLTDAKLVVFPELLNYAQLIEDLEPDALLVLSTFVSGGGGLISVGDYGFRLLNHIFYPGCGLGACFASTGTAGDSLLDANVAAGTPYEAAPASLSVPPTLPGAVNPYAFFPAGGLQLYHDPDGGSTVLTAPYGVGKYGYLAWGYGGSVPSGSLDGGWVPLMRIMAEDVPAPSAALLLGGFLPLLALRRAHPGVGSERKNSR